MRRENYQEIPEFIQMGERFGFNVSFSESMILANTECFFDDPQSDTFKHFVRIVKA